MTNAHRSLFFASLTILSWSTVSTAFKLSLAAMTPLQMIAVSMTVGGLVFALVLAVAALRGELHSFRSSDAAGAVIAGPVIAVYYFVLFQGYSLLPAQVAQPINYTWSIVLAIMLCVAHREPLSVRQVFWMLTAWAGAALIAAGGRDIGHISPAGIGLMIFSTLLFPLFWLLSDRSRLPQALFMLISFTGAAALSWAGVLWEGRPFPEMAAILPAVYLGFFELSLPYLFWGKALRLADSVALLGTLPMIVPFLALFWIHLFLGEPILLTTILGLTFTVAGTFLQAREGRKRHAASSRADRD